MNESENAQSVDNLKKLADEAKLKYQNESFGVKDYIKDAVSMLFWTAVAYGWGLLMLLIISFISLGVWHMEFENMLIYSIVPALIMIVLYVRKFIKKYT